MAVHPTAIAVECTTQYCVWSSESIIATLVDDIEDAKQERNQY